MASSSSSSAETVAGNDDLLTEILVRLPAKILVKLKCVSKQWISLISSRPFSLLHTLRNPNSNYPSAIFLYRTNPLELVEFEFEFSPLTKTTTCKPPFTSLTFPDEPIGLQILQSCNGLFLLCSGYGIAVGNSSVNYYIYNPTTKQYSILPPYHATESWRNSSVLGLNLAFDSSKSPHYKVVCIQRSPTASTNPNPIHGCGDIHVYIYSSETRSWRNSGSQSMMFHDLDFCNGVFCNDSIHWISNLGFSMRFNLETEAMTEMPRVQPWAKMYFGECNGRLYLVGVSGELTHFGLMEMEMDYSHWVVKYRVDLFTYPGCFRCKLYQVLGLVRCHEGERDSSLLLLLTCGKLISYRLEDSTFNDLCGLPSGGRILDAYNHFESLAYP